MQYIQPPLPCSPWMQRITWQCHSAGVDVALGGDGGPAGQADLGGTWQAGGARQAGSAGQAEAGQLEAPASGSLLCLLCLPFSRLLCTLCLSCRVYLEQLQAWSGGGTSPVTHFVESMLPPALCILPAAMVTHRGKAAALWHREGPQS